LRRSAAALKEQEATIIKLLDDRAYYSKLFSEQYDRDRATIAILTAQQAILEERAHEIGCNYGELIAERDKEIATLTARVKELEKALSKIVETDVSGANWILNRTQCGLIARATLKQGETFLHYRSEPVPPGEGWFLVRSENGRSLWQNEDGAQELFIHSLKGEKE
jgi:hypothetical protein